jgi:hypothetical protein
LAWQLGIGLAICNHEAHLKVVKVACSVEKIAFLKYPDVEAI